MKPTTLIIRVAGTNCDRELAHAFELAGAKTSTIHLNQLIEQPDLLKEVDLIGFPGGFSYGDDIAAGRIFANRLRHRLFDPLCDAIGRRVPVIGICNGFQVLVKLGLLPDPKRRPVRQSATLAENFHGRFIDRWVRLVVSHDTSCIWTRGLSRLELPIAHGEGQFVVESEAELAEMGARGQLVLRYDTEPHGASETFEGIASGNPNGSVDDIAGICDPSGLVLGLMPHPERYMHPTHHPFWTRAGSGETTAPASGLRMIRNAVEYVRGERGVG